jgi:hypothetical protein
VVGVGIFSLPAPNRERVVKAVKVQIPRRLLVRGGFFIERGFPLARPQLGFAVGSQAKGTINIPPFTAKVEQKFWLSRVTRFDSLDPDQLIVSA